MGYIGRAATNAGSVRYLDNISSGFDGSDVTFTAQVAGVSITPGQENINLYLDGVFQHPGSGNAYTISGSTITFTAAPVANTVFTAYVVGEGAYLDDATVITAKIGDDAITAAKLDDDGTGFQVGDLGVGGSLTSGDKLTVTGRLRASAGIIGALTGNATTATTLATARTIGGVSFDGSANIAVTLAATATTLATARAINGVDFNGSAAITVTAAAGTLSGNTLKSTVTASSLTSVGTLTGLSVDGGTSSLNRGNSSGDILDVRGQNTSQMKVTTTAFTVTPNAAFTGNIGVGSSTVSSPSSASRTLRIQHATGSASLVLCGDCDNESAWDILADTGGHLDMRKNNSSILKVRGVTNDWGATLESAGAYGLHIHTTGTSSGHDAFKISRHDNAIIFQVFADAATINKNDLTVLGSIRTESYRLFDDTVFCGGLYREEVITGSGSSRDVCLFSEGATDGGAIHFMTGGSVTKVLTLDASNNAYFAGSVTSPSNAKFWVRSDVYTNNDVRDSYNCDGHTHHSTGNLTYSFTTNMPSSVYCLVGSGHYGGGTNDVGNVSWLGGNLAAASCRVQFNSLNNYDTGAFAAFDPEEMMLVIFDN